MLFKKKTTGILLGVIALLLISIAPSHANANEKFEGTRIMLETKDNTILVEKQNFSYFGQFDARDSVLSGTEYIPLKNIVLATDGEIEWDAAAEEAFVRSNGNTILFKVGESNISKNGDIIDLGHEHTPKLDNNRMHITTKTAGELFEFDFENRPEARLEIIGTRMETEKMVDGLLNIATWLSR